VLRFVGKVEYVDGEIVEFKAGSRALAEWERYASRHKLGIGKESPPILSSLVIAHFALGIEEGFDAWVDRVDGIELAAEGGDDAEVPPTPPVASTE